MSQYRLIGVACDDETDGVLCDSGFELTGGATYTDVLRSARQQGWYAEKVFGPHYCPDHAEGKAL